MSHWTTIFVGIVSGLGGIALGWTLACRQLGKEYEDKCAMLQETCDQAMEDRENAREKLENLAKKYENDLDHGLKTVKKPYYEVIPELENEDPDDEIDFFDDGAPEEQEGAESDEDENGELKEPFVITKEMFDHDYAYCDSEEMHWYPNDCTLADFNNEVVPNPYDILGDQGMAELDANSNTTGKDVIYVHNDSMDVNYEVVIHHHEYFND